MANSLIPAERPNVNLQPSSTHILSLPPEILQHILLTVTTPTFLQLVLTCRHFFNLAAESRAVLLEHLHQLPGLKLGLSDPLSISTPELFASLGRRAAQHLYGVNFTADCTDYGFRHATINPDACVLAEGREYINIALALRESLTVRLYGGRCVRKEVIESPYGDGRGRILKILQWNTTITVLYEWIDEDEVVLTGSSITKDPNTRRKSEAVSRALRRRPRSRSPSSQLPTASPSPSRSNSPMAGLTARTFEQEATENSSPLKFHLLHYNAYSFSKPLFFSIQRYKENLVPVSVAVQGRRKCAILWDQEGSLRPGTDAVVVLYTTELAPYGEEGTYDARQVWPPRQLSNREDGVPRLPPSTYPKRIAFFHEGYRLALYAPGQIVPYEVVSTNGSMSANLSNSILLSKSSNIWTIDQPFWGNHETYTEKVDRETEDDDDEREPEERTYCQHTYLCLGTAVIEGVKIAGILRSRTRNDHDDCRHLVEYDTMPHTNVNSKLVARLWGWTECMSTLPGCVAWSGWSSPVRFVAIAHWDRVFIWAIAVSELSEEFEGEAGEGHGDDDEDGSDTGNGNPPAQATNAPGTTTSPKGKGKQKEEEKAQAEVPGYYEREWDENLQAYIAELTPIVLKMDNHAVIRKMVWSRHSDGDESEDEIETDDEVLSTYEMDAEEAITESGDYPVDAGFMQDPVTGAWNLPLFCALPRGISVFGGGADASPRVGEPKEGKGKAKERKRNPPGLRLKMLTDRGVSIWELGTWSRGRRKKGWLDEVLV